MTYFMIKGPLKYNGEIATVEHDIPMLEGSPPGAIG
jgi:hypothetical protein